MGGWDATTSPVTSAASCRRKRGPPGLAPRGEHAEDIAQSLADVLQVGSRTRRKGQRILLFVGLDFSPQVLACARDGESFFVEQLFDAQNAFDVLAAIHALASAALYRLELGKLGFPEAQDVSGQVAETGNFSDAEIEFFRNQHLGGC